jgi:hypothetical protein
MECAKKQRSFTVALDLVVLLIVAVVFTARCSFPLPASNGWKKYSDDRFGYGVMVPSDWKIQASPAIGQAATMTIINYDSSEVIQSGLEEKNQL